MFPKHSFFCDYVIAILAFKKYVPREKSGRYVHVSVS